MTCTGGRLAAFFAMDSPLSVSRDVRRYPSILMLQSIRNFFRYRNKSKRIQELQRAFHSGRTLSRFVAKDVEREIKVVSIDEIESGFIVAAVRTNNILYTGGNLVAEANFGEPHRLSVTELWNWTGQSWGGLPDGTSIVDHLNLDSPQPDEDG